MKRISLTTASTDAFFVTICAVATLHCTNHAKPFGPELQVKQMLARRCAGGKKRINNIFGSFM